jgi:hydrogenase maturation protein HypF
MPGGTRAIDEPWRNAYAHLRAAFDWHAFTRQYVGLDVQHFLKSRPRAALETMIAQHVNSPLASSAGRLFDAVAATLGVCRERVHYEGQAAIELEALVDPQTLRDDSDAHAYPFEITGTMPDGLRMIEPRPMWQALLDDLLRGTAVPVVVARFHKGLAIVIVRMVECLADQLTGPVDARSVALSGGVFQNRVLFEQVVNRLEAVGFRVLTHHQVPANDGGLSLGQAVVAAAQCGDGA